MKEAKEKNSLAKENRTHRARWRETADGRSKRNSAPDQKLNSREKEKNIPMSRREERDPISAKESLKILFSPHVKEGGRHRNGRERQRVAEETFKG